MEEQNSTLPPKTAEWRGGSGIENKRKVIYVPPTLGTIEVALESHIAAGSITVKETNEMVEESWMVEDDVVKDIDIDLF